MTELLLILRLPASPAAAGAARHAVCGLAPFLERAVLENTELLVSELVTNSVRHARLRPSESVELTLRASSEAILIEVTDRGRGFGGRRPRSRTMAEAVAADRASGWGLFLVDQIADRWGIVEDGGTRVWFELRPGAKAGLAASPAGSQAHVDPAADVRGRGWATRSRS